MPFTKQGEFTFKHSNQVDEPTPAITSDELKTLFDSQAEELKTSNNALVDELEANTAAGVLGALDGSGATSTIQTEINTNRNGLANHKAAAVLDHPDGSVTTVKIANSAVTTSKIANGAITVDKLDSSLTNQPSTVAGIQAKFVEVDASLSEVITLFPSGDADTDTENIQSAFENYRNVRFASNDSGEFKINQTITINPINTDYGLRGRIIDFNNCNIQVESKNGITPDYVFIFTSNVWPDNLRSTEVKNVHFSGTVNKAFIKVQAGAMWGCSFENITSYTGSYAESVIEFNSHLSGSNGGLNIVKRIHSHSTHVKYALNFTVGASGDSHFDDFTIEQITSNYMDGNQGATINLGNNAYLVYSNIKVVYQGGKGHVILGGSNTFLFDCVVENLYAEPKSPTAIGVSVAAQRCDFRNFHLKYDPAVTTFARAYYGEATKCRFSSFIHTNNSGSQLTTIYAEIFTGDGNVFERIGDSTSSFIKMDATSHKNKVTNKYGDPFLYAYGSTLKTYNAGATISNDALLTFYKNDILNNAILRCKIRGNTNASANNRFTIRLAGTSVNYTLLNFAVDTASQWEIDIDIVRYNTTQFMFFSKSLVDGVLQTSIHNGTPDKTALTAPTDLKIVADVTNSSLIYVMVVDCMKIDYVSKPI